MPGRQRRMLLGWAGFHQEELMENWKFAEKKQELFSVEPMKLSMNAGECGERRKHEQRLQYYLSKGCDVDMAEYFAAGHRKITAIQPNKDCTHALEFDNGEQRIYDCKLLLREGAAPFQSYENFKSVYLDDVAWDIDSRIVWHDKVDLRPDCCYVGSSPE